MSRLSLILALLLSRIFLAAQTPDSASLRGQVLDQTHAAVIGAQVKITNSRLATAKSTQTDASGRFSFSGMPVGDYSLTVHQDGFADLQRDITLVGGTNANVTLQLNVSEVKTEVVVTGAAGEVRADMPQLGDRLGPQQVQDMPLLNSRITYLPLLNAANRPALNQGDAFMNQNLFTTSGSGRRQTSFVVDGASGNDSWGRQTIFTNIPRVAVQEMTVLENAFAAEYGATTGGVVNVVTRTGGRHYHGDLIGVWRPNDTSAKLSGFTTANASNGNQIVSDSMGQLSAAFSGPIPHTQATEFFFGGEYTRENRGSPITSALSPGVFVGHYADWMTFLRLDHQINQNNSAFLKANTDSFHDTNPNGTVGGATLPTVDRIFRRRTYSLELGETATLSSTLLNSARMQFQLASPITEFDPVIFGTQFVVPIAGAPTFTTGTSQSALLMNRQFGGSDTVALTRGNQELKFGADVLYAHTGGDSKEFGGPIFLGQFQFKPCPAATPIAICETTYLNDIANVQSYTQSFGNGSYTVDDTLWSLFAQDDFRVRQDLTLNLGLRYEQQTFTDARKNFAPRVGFAYDLLQHHNTIIRGGFGIYYAQVVDNSEANYALSGPTGVFNFTAQAGQIGFPISLTGVPLAAPPIGAALPVRSIYIRPGQASFYNQFFDTSVLKGYPDALLNPYSEQWTLGVERQLGHDWVLSVDYVGSHTVKVVRPLDVDSPAPFVRTAQGQTRSAQAANCTRPLWVAFYAAAGLACPATANPAIPQPAFGAITTDVNNGFVRYNSLNVNLSHSFARRFAMLASYVYSHAIDNVDPDVPGQNPNDPNFVNEQEIGNAIFDQRHRFVLSGAYQGPFGLDAGGIATLASGLPFNLVTGSNNSGDPGATADRPVINGAVVGRNTGRGTPIYDFSPFVEKVFPLGENARAKLRVEAFNVFNHPNFVGFIGTVGNGTGIPATLGQPLAGITNQLPARSLQFSFHLNY
ncbi:MAG TPA: TonB-dependent receptor [Candidatus Angelobacter sp.]|nr:TonB-dependent receptor [Candidatus Angelobacter sp.]